ncbi:hypothetical protein AAFF_G00140570 [Aldrovandia affinis]|uniref:Uncharacterized protein n=1 Tax=Aldrovandia affinis TaxID=143900 RepID=A0AAD7X306_9TELE|nr:hypothetical protein AAFF_G00140570 [Aldrovandia affinis]
MVRAHTSAELAEAQLREACSSSGALGSLSQLLLQCQLSQQRRSAEQCRGCRTPLCPNSVQAFLQEHKDRASRTCPEHRYPPPSDTHTKAGPERGPGGYASASRASSRATDISSFRDGILDERLQTCLTPIPDSFPPATQDAEAHPRVASPANRSNCSSPPLTPAPSPKWCKVA